MVIRDSAGSVIGALTQRIPLPSYPATVEALACKGAMLFAKELSIFETVVEGDAEIIIKALQSKDTRNPEFAHNLFDALVFANDLRVCSFS